MTDAKVDPVASVEENVGVLAGSVVKILCGMKDIEAIVNASQAALMDHAKQLDQLDHASLEHAKRINKFNDTCVFKGINQVDVRIEKDGKIEEVPIDKLFDVKNEEILSLQKKNFELTERVQKLEDSLQTLLAELADRVAKKASEHVLESPIYKTIDGRLKHVFRMCEVLDRRVDEETGGLKKLCDKSKDSYDELFQAWKDQAVAIHLLEQKVFRGIDRPGEEVGGQN